MKDKQIFLRQSEAFSFWLCDTGGETYPTNQLLAWTWSSRFLHSWHLSSCQIKSNPALAAILKTAFTSSLQGSLPRASSSHASKCLVERRTSLLNTPALVCWTGAYSHLQVRHITAEDRGIIPSYANSKNQMHPPVHVKHKPSLLPLRTHHQLHIAPSINLNPKSIWLMICCTNIRRKEGLCSWNISGIIGKLWLQMQSRSILGW